MDPLTLDGVVRVEHLVRGSAPLNQPSATSGYSPSESKTEFASDTRVKPYRLLGSGLPYTM